MKLLLAASSPEDIRRCAASSAATATHRERVSTIRHTTLGRIGLAFAFLLGACGGDGGSRRGDTYAAATSAQEQCCEHLVPGPRDNCLRDIVRVQDESVARSASNQDTYECVQEHFACDPGTGRATQPSAQAQLDCIQDLP
jgi:hypothetical protein